jgi:hypothetical protein
MLAITISTILAVIGPQTLLKGVLHSPFDVVINELMVRPSPSIGLPEAEYIELYNRSEMPVNLHNWTIWVGARTRTLPQHILPPGGYVLIVHENFSGMLDEYGDVIVFQGFPVLSVSGQTIVLMDPGAKVISAVRYTDKWYQSTLKASGGWSLEQIDPYNPCEGELNWKASTSSQGGTPGSVNSVFSLNRDSVPPAITRASITTSGTIMLHFSEPMHPLSGWSADEYYATGLGHPDTAVPVQPFFDRVGLTFRDLPDEGVDVLVKIAGNLYDCAGNFIDINGPGARFTMPGYPVAGDIALNEILFNPFPGGVDFIELLNISSKTLDLRQVILAGMTGGNPEPAYIIAQDGFLLFPGEYALLTTNPLVIMSHYYVPAPNTLVAMERMPPLNNESGRVAIANLQMEIIDELSYTSDMHSPLLANRKGVSLERINHGRPASDPTNWISASGNSGFATPGYRNSQFTETPASSQKVLAVDPRIFSPDNSGYNDIVNISYELTKPGYCGNITIYDSRGRSIKRLVRNEILGTSGVFSWDGRNESNSQSGLGIYLILLEVFHPDGEVKKYRETVVLGGRFRN